MDYVCDDCTMMKGNPRNNVLVSNGLADLGVWGRPWGDHGIEGMKS